VVHDFEERSRHTLDDVLVDVVWDDGQSDRLAGVVENFADFLILYTNHVLPINLQKVVINQKAIPAGWSVDGDGSDFAIFVFEAQMVAGILGESDCPLERPGGGIPSSCFY